jgi:hypothetical protein
VLTERGHDLRAVSGWACGSGRRRQGAADLGARAFDRAFDRWIEPSSQQIFADLAQEELQALRPDGDIERLHRQFKTHPPAK